jgi:hypothetical protein
VYSAGTIGISLRLSTTKFSESMDWNL